MATWFVNATSGSDANAGTSAGAAFATAQKGCNSASNGDFVTFAPGTYSTFDTAKALSFNILAGTTGDVLFTGSSSSFLCRIQSTCTAFSIVGNYNPDQWFKFTNTFTDLTTSTSYGLFLDKCPTTTADSYHFERCWFYDCGKNGIRFEHPGGLTLQSCKAELCGVGFDLYNSQTDGQLYGSNILIQDCEAINCNKMVKNTSASSDYGGVGLALERVHGGAGSSRIIVRRYKAHGCYAPRDTTSQPEAYDGAGIEWFASDGILVDGFESYDNKNIIETGTQDVGTGHVQATTANGSTSIGATTATMTAIPSRWAIGQCVYFDTAGTKEVLQLTGVNTGTKAITFRRLGTASSGLASAHSTGVRVALAMPCEGTVINVSAWRGSVVPDGYGRGWLIAPMSNSMIEKCTFGGPTTGFGFDQFAVSIATPVGDPFAGSTYNLTFRDVAIASNGGVDGIGQTRRGLQDSDPDFAPNHVYNNCNIYNSAVGGVFGRINGSDKTSLATLVSALGASVVNGMTGVDPQFLAGTVRPSSSSPLIDSAVNFAETANVRVRYGSLWDRGGYEFLNLAETFTRTTANGWGTSDTGQTYTIFSTAANYSTNGTSGLVSVSGASVTRAVFSSGTFGNVDLRCVIATDKVAVGGAQNYYVTARQTSISSDFAGVQVSFTTGQAVQLLLTTMAAGVPTTVVGTTVIGRETHAAARMFNVRLQVIGGTAPLMRAKIWAVGTTEPTAWDVSGTAASGVQATGGYGARLNLASGTSNGPVVFSMDDVYVLDIPNTSDTADSFSIVESAKRVGLFGRPIPQTVTVTDAVTRQAVLHRYPVTNRN